MATQRPQLIQGPEIRIAMPLLLGVVALFAVGCGGPSNPPKSASTAAPASPHQVARILDVDPCRLVTEKDASIAVGTSVAKAGPAVLAPAQGGGICYYTNSELSASVYIYAIVLPDENTAHSQSADQIALTMGAAFSLTHAKVLSGIGDQAIEYNTTGTGDTAGMAVFVVKSNLALVIAIAPLKDPGAIETLARTAVGRL